MCSNTLILQYTSTKARAFVPRCNSWKCPKCAPRRVRKLKAQAASGNPDTFLTLTVNPHVLDNPTERAQRAIAGWRNLVKRIKRHYRYDKLEYLVVLEQTKRGEPHLHILLRCKWIDQRWLSAQWLDLTGAKIVDIRRVKHARQVASYVAKYIAKAPARFGKLKRYYRSHRYCDPQKKRASGHDWHNATTILHASNMTMLLHVWRSEGIVIDQPSVSYVEVDLTQAGVPPPLAKCGREIFGRPAH